MAVLNKKSILRKTIQVGSSTLISRFLGLLREIVWAHYIPFGVISDAFFSAYKLPNSLRKIFAEGALSSSFVPTIVHIEKNGNTKEINSLMTLSFLIFEGVVFFLCLFVLIFSKQVISFTTPGFSAEQVAYTVPFLKILIFFILFLSSSSLLAGALQAVHHFFIPAIGPVLLNVICISGALIGIILNLPVKFLCYAILVGGLLQFILHLIFYFKYNFHFSSINYQAWLNFKLLLKRFFPILLSMSIMEVILFIDESLASYLPVGSISLIYYAHRFLGIPLGAFGTAFSTILLPHFSRISSYAPKRLSFYLFESTKLIFWITVPVTILMSFFSDKIFITLFLSEKFPMSKVIEAHYILIAFLVGLFFFSINKILVNVYYSLHNMIIPTAVSLISAIVNLSLNYLLMKLYNATGLAVAMTISLGFVQTILLLMFLFKRYNFTIYPKHLIKFFVKYILQLTISLICFFIIYYFLKSYIEFLPTNISNLLLNKVYFWLWIGPLCLLLFAALYKSRKFFGIKLYFLD